MSKVFKRSGGGILGLSRNFRIVDRDRSGQLSRDEFEICMKKFQIDLTIPEIHVLFDFYDSDHSGQLDFNEFLKGLRSKLSPQRRALAEQAFNAFDTDGSGEIDHKDLEEKYDASRHPKVLSREWTKKQVLDHFISQFEGDNGNKDGVITKDEWMDYHAGLSSNIDTDDEFGMMMANNWGIEYIPQSEVDAIIKLIKSKSEQKGTGGNPKKVAKDAFKRFDADNSGNIDQKEFIEAMEFFSPGLNVGALKTLFRMFDKDNSGTIEYEEIVALAWQ